MLNYQKNKQKRNLGNAFFLSLFPLDTLSFNSIYFLLKSKKFDLLTSAGIIGGLREVSQKGQEIKPSDKRVARLFYFFGAAIGKRGKASIS
jgi:hypothetical protein